MSAHPPGADGRRRHGERRSKADSGARRRVAVIGGRGMLGRAWTRELRQRGIDVVELDLPRFNLLDHAHRCEFITPDLGLVINCAAYTDVDGAEQNEPEAFQLNACAVSDLAAHCRAAGAGLIHYSTDYVFDGRGAAPYAPGAEPAPINAYGRTKLAGEVSLVASGAEFLLVRTSWLYAAWGENFVSTILRLARERESIRVVNDQRGRPSFAEHVAAASRRLWSQGQRGVYHITDGGECTWHEFACEIVRQSGLECRVEPCATSEFPRPAARPRYSVLDLTRTEEALGPMPSWRDNLRMALTQMNGATAAAIDTAILRSPIETGANASATAPRRRASTTTNNA